MHRPRQDGGTRKRHAQCLSRTLRNGKPQMRRKPWMMPVLWKWPVPVSGLWPVFRSASQWQSASVSPSEPVQTLRQGYDPSGYRKMCSCPDIPSPADTSRPPRASRAGSLRLPCRKRFFLSAGNFPALGHRAMLRRGSGNREQIRHPGAVELHVPSTICLCYVYNRNKFPRICLAEALWFIDGDIVGKPKSTVSSASSVFCESEYVWIKFPIPRCIVSGKEKEIAGNTEILKVSM